MRENALFTELKSVLVIVDLVLLADFLSSVTKTWYGCPGTEIHKLMSQLNRQMAFCPLCLSTHTARCLFGPNLQCAAFLLPSATQSFCWFEWSGGISCAE